ncbi:hypothetical protein ACFC8N_42505 [Streptomyces sp. NPDC055966]|uniref:hypothetical protein n=1 Tax=Streptomyces sp. NPDC055966 TaxID=3345669 RepID=UPI0035DC8EB0
MGNTDDTDGDGAAARLHHLQQYYREHPVTGPAEGHRTTVHSGAPLSLATLDHVTASVREVAEHTYAVNPGAGPIPESVAAVYDWCHAHTEHAPETVRARGEVIEFRQFLEHAIRAGDHAVVRKQRCPKCRTWGLMWQQQMQRAVCTNTDCVDRDGFSRTFDLARLAYEHVAARKNLRQASAT